jgi:ankyrin repeat protein
MLLGAWAWCVVAAGGVTNSEWPCPGGITEVRGNPPEDKIRECREGGKPIFGYLTDAHAAAKSKDVTLIKSFQNQACLINARDASGRIPLGISVGSGDLAGTKAWLEMGANPNISSCLGWTPLYVAETFRLKNRVSMIEVLVDAGADINAQTGADPYGGEENFTTLREAVVGFDVEVVELLLKRGASVSLRDAYGWTARELAERFRAWAGSREPDRSQMARIIELLLEAEKGISGS